MATDDTGPPDDLPGLPPELGGIVGRAAAGDEAVMPQLYALLDRRPGIWQAVRDLAHRAEVALLQHLAGRDLFTQEATRRTLAALREEFAPVGPLEGLLVGRLVLAWGEVSAAQLESFQLAASAPRDVGLHRVVQARLEGANKRFLAAARTLALTRRLLAKTGARDAASKKTQESSPAEGTWAGTFDPVPPAPPRRRGPLLGAVA
jgi:hypothetical protein